MKCGVPWLQRADDTDFLPVPCLTFKAKLSPVVTKSWPPWKEKSYLEGSFTSASVMLNPCSQPSLKNEWMLNLLNTYFSLALYKGVYLLRKLLGSWQHNEIHFQRMHCPSNPRTSLFTGLYQRPHQPAVLFQDVFLINKPVLCFMHDLHISGS